MIIKSKLAHIFGDYTAITIWPFIFSDKVPMDAPIERHERKHLEQWKRGFWIGFLFKYLYYHAKYGYWNNPYEVEARKAEYGI